MKNSRQRVLEAINGHVEETGFPPTLREIAEEAGLKSTWTVRYHLKKLTEQGVLKVRGKLSRGIELLKRSSGIPLLGRISAGRPIDAIENVEARIDNLSDYFGAKDTFALLVKGDSMEGAGIFDGDIVIVKKQEKAEQGQIAVALVGDEVTVKRFYSGKKGVVLKAENPKYSDIVSEDVKVMGVVKGVIRKL